MNNQLTQEDVDKLKTELDYRNTTLRFEIAKEKMEAAAFGDRSENAEYKAAKQRYYENNRRMGYLKRMIKSSTIVAADNHEGKVSIGSTVKVKFLDDDDTDEFTLQTVLNADPLENIISIDSPIGKAIIGKSIGDIVQVKFPDGIHSLEIIAFKIANKLH